MIKIVAIDMKQRRQEVEDALKTLFVDRDSSWENIGYLLASASYSLIQKSNAPEDNIIELQIGFRDYIDKNVPESEQIL